MSKDGGPAFPQGEKWSTTDLVGNRTDNSKAALHHGMTLRDYFAAQFMDRACCMSQSGDGDWDYDTVALCCYAQADAMLKARSA